MKILIEKSTQNIIKQRGICHLIHFTDIVNLESILHNGLCSVAKLCESDVAYKSTDCDRLDGFIDCVSYSIEFSNYMYLKSLIQKNDNKYIVLRISVECLFDKVVYVHKSNPFLPRWGEAKNFEDLFFNEYRSQLLPAKYPTDPRAEIQFDGVVSPRYINGIFYPSNFNHSLINHLEKENSGFRFIKDDYYFCDRMDSLHWHNIRRRGLDLYKVE